MKIKNILFFVLFLILILFGFSNINKSTENLDIDRVKNSLDTALITCYSVEGRYPESVQYLRKNYGFTYDKNSYFITYDWQGDNVYPNIYVYRKGNEWWKMQVFSFLFLYCSCLWCVVLCCWIFKSKIIRCFKDAQNMILKHILLFLMSRIRFWYYVKKKDS